MKNRLTRQSFDVGRFGIAQNQFAGSSISWAIAGGNESFRTGERNGKGEKEIPAFVMKKLRAHQMRQPANYKQAMVLYQVCKRREETMPISENNKQRLTAIGYDVQGWTQAMANRAWQEFYANNKQKPLVSRV
jgi:hypothetical protein